MIDISDDHYALDISRARALLGWEPRHSLRNTLPIMLNDLKSDPAGWYQENDLKVTPIPDGPALAACREHASRSVAYRDRAGPRHDRARAALERSRERCGDYSIQRACDALCVGCVDRVRHWSLGDERAAIVLGLERRGLQ